MSALAREGSWPQPLSVFSLKIIADAHSSEDMLALATQADTLVPITFLVIVGTVTLRSHFSTSGLQQACRF